MSAILTDAASAESGPPAGTEPTCDIIIRTRGASGFDVVAAIESGLGERPMNVVDLESDDREQRMSWQASRLSFKLTTYDLLGICVNSMGAVLAAIEFSEWVTLTVAVVATLTGIVEFTQLRNQVVSNNLALRDLQTLLVKWDSLSVVRRRTDVTKSQVVETAERSVIMVVDARTTAASNTQTSVEKQLANEPQEEE